MLQAMVQEQNLQIGALRIQQAYRKRGQEAELALLRHVSTSVSRAKGVTFILQERVLCGRFIDVYIQHS